MQQRFYKNGKCAVYKETAIAKEDGSVVHQETKVVLPYTTRCRICNRRLYTIEQNGTVTVHTNYIHDELCEDCGNKIGHRLVRRNKRDI